MIDPIYSTEKYCNYTREYSTMQNYSYFKKRKFVHIMEVKKIKLVLTHDTYHIRILHYYL